jgi:large subunit ribosomal protein L5e
MGFVKVVKNKAYFKRYQVKYRRRREGKTDYRARRAMTLQDKTKYGAPKFRLVARITNRDVIAQIVHPKVVGDDTLMAAYSHELKQYGITFGLTNYAAAYATGLLVARRTLAKLGIADKFAGAKEANGEFKTVRLKSDKEDESEERFPFKAILDVGLARTTTGANIFGVLKGAVDGGLAVPHKPNRFPGFKKGKLDAKVHRDRIFGKHVAEYLKQVKEEKASNPDEKVLQFSALEKAGVQPKDIESIYKKAHAAIRANPLRKASDKKAPATRKRYGSKRLSYKARANAVKTKIATLRQKLGK